MWSKKRSIEVLTELALASEKGSDRIAAIKELNKMFGWDKPEIVEQGNNGGEANTLGLGEYYSSLKDS